MQANQSSVEDLQRRISSLQMQLSEYVEKFTTAHAANMSLYEENEALNKQLEEQLNKEIDEMNEKGGKNDDES